MSVRVSVAYCPGPERQSVIELEMEAGATVAQAIEASRLLIVHPEIGPGKLAIGVSGELATPATVLQEGDRVEIYRPLRADPKSARRKRAAPRRGR